MKRWYGRTQEGLARPLRRLKVLPSPIAIDLGVRWLKVLQIMPGDPPSLVALGAVQTPEQFLSDAPGRLAFQGEALAGLVRSAGFKGRRAVCAIPASMTTCRQFHLTRTEGVSVKALVRDELTRQARRDASEFVYRYTLADSAGKGCEAICLAVARRDVARLMGVVRSARLEPVGMHVEYLALVRGFDQITRRSEDHELTSLYVDIGHGSTKVAMAHGTELVFARSIDLGGLRLDEAVADQLDCSLAAAAQRRAAMGRLKAGAPRAGEVVCAGAGEDGPDSDWALRERRSGLTPAGFTPDLAGEPAAQPAPGDSVDLSEQIEILTDEISMCLRYHGSRFSDRRIDRTVFVGGEARQLEMCQRIARSLRLAAQAADPLARVARTGNEPSVGVDPRQPQPGWAVAMGLCSCPSDL